jgi:hypothetical protein
LIGATVSDLAARIGAGLLVGFKKLHEIGEQDGGQAAIPRAIFFSWTRLHWLSKGSNRPCTNCSTLWASVPRDCSRWWIIIQITKRAE